MLATRIASTSRSLKTNSCIKFYSCTNPLVTLVSEFDASLVASGIQDVVVATGLLS